MANGKVSFSFDGQHMQPEPWEASPTPPERPRYRPPIGIPVHDGRGWRGVVASIAFHALIIFLLTSPFTVPKTLELIEQGAGGPGPAGGGGGGNRGTGGAPANERLRYIQIAPAPKPAATPAPVPPPVPKVEQKKPEEPKPVPPPVQEPVPPAPAAAVAAASAPTPGTGGGTGNDGTAGTGPGSGGGTGSGVGTGTGSGTGPGTGGGDADRYSPTPRELFMPPQPIPNSVRGREVVAQFDVDEKGKVLKCDFTPTPDRGYNRKLRELLCQMTFRPAVTREGRPVRAVAQVTYTIY